MIKKTPYGTTLKEQLKANAKDRITNFTLADGRIRGVLVHATRMVNEMRGNHELGILETLALGHAYIATSLLSANLKGRDRVALKVECSGPIKGIQTEANSFGEIRGYLSQNPIPLENPLESFDLAPFFGAGFLTVTKTIEGMKQPFSGQVALEYGNLAQDLAHYFVSSEQTPTATSLSVHFDNDGNVIGAGGLFLQAFPDATDEDIERLEAEIASLGSIGEHFANDIPAEDLVNEKFASLSPKILGGHRIEFYCRCEKKQMVEFMTGLPDAELSDIHENGPFPLVVTCHNCNSAYSFDQAEIAAIIARKKTGVADA